jgi:diguanylate cyclase (GGDEF)-like protein
MQKKPFFIFTVIALLFVIVVWCYVDYIQEEKKSFEVNIYKKEASFMQKTLASMLDEKKKSTTAIAITLASNDLLPQLLSDKKSLQSKLNQLIDDFKKYTNYKNIWIHILDKEAHSIYRSWSKESDDRFCRSRKDLRYVIEHKKILSFISLDIFSINIKAIVPLYNSKKEFMGLIEVISHFNSISNSLKKLDVESVVIVNKQDSKNIKYPFTNTFIGDHYIANFNVSKKLLNYLQEHRIDHYCKPLNVVENGYIITTYPLKNYVGDTIAYYIMFKDINSVSKTGLEFFIFRWSVFAIFLFMVLAGIINIVLYLSLHKQKRYYKKILDTASNIVLVNDKKEIVDANKTLFKYFPKYKNIEEFRAKNSCICDFFVNEEGYLYKGKDEASWIDYILKNQDKTHKVKMKIDDKIYYFMIYVSLITKDPEHYSVIFSDITEQEIYKKELENLSLHDPLTHIGNRRKYQQKLDNEMARACRYKTPFSIISFDLDHFKKVNDTHGHMVGDAVLVEYTGLVNSLLRGVDEVFRVGGEEFIIITPNTNREAAQILAEKLRKAIEDHHKIVHITASFGVTEYKICEDEESFLKRVDDALYEAKNSGRNRVIVR